jgi:predicted nuclease with TOPRIM domain
LFINGGISMTNEEFKRYIFMFNNTPTTKKANIAFKAMQAEVERLQQENDRLKNRNKSLVKRYSKVCNKLDLIKKGRTLNESGEIV